MTWIGGKGKGCQDDHEQYEELDSWGKANVQADKLADNKHATNPTTRTATQTMQNKWIAYNKI